MIALLSTIPDAPPIACTIRPKINTHIDVDITQIKLPIKNIVKPINITGRLPYRSEAGPYARAEIAIEIREVDNTSWACIGETLKASCIAGKAGRKICIDMGPRAVIAARMKISRREEVALFTKKPTQVQQELRPYP
tara:strand:- start:118 stop:528 length:411 start_codon:yes stop_codon:yes gene_type:complete